jgi:hypothetical protein
MVGGWRKLHNEEVHNLYPLPSIKEDEMCSACVECMRERRNAYRLLVIELELKRQL